MVTKSEKIKNEKFMIDHFLVREVYDDYIIINVDGRSFKIDGQYDVKKGDMLKIQYSEKTKDKTLKNYKVK